MISKKQEYINYIQEHVSNVKKAYKTYGKLLCEFLHCDYDKILRDQINIHDDSKYSEEEFELYRLKFFPKKNEIISTYDFNLAWNHHIQCNPHHPEHWIYTEFDRNTTLKKVDVHQMPNNYIIEMLCDWIGMGYKFNNKAYDYYYSNGGNNKLLSAETRAIVEQCLDIIKQYDLDNNIL